MSEAGDRSCHDETDGIWPGCSSPGTRGINGKIPAVSSGVFDGTQSDPVAEKRVALVRGDPEGEYSVPTGCRPSVTCCRSRDFATVGCDTGIPSMGRESTLHFYLLASTCQWDAPRGLCLPVTLNLSRWESTFHERAFFSSSTASFHHRIKDPSSWKVLEKKIVYQSMRQPNPIP